MEALVLEENGRIVHKKVPVPEKTRKDALLCRVAASGICNSDIHRGFGGGAYHYPLIMGHEFSAVIEDPGASTRYKEGDGVTVFPLLPCKKCGPCQAGEYAQCINYDYFGSRRDGAFAEYVWVPEENLFPIPEHVEMLHAAMTEPAAVALHGVRRMEIKAGYTGAVFGGGPIGNMVAQWLRISGCSEVFVIDIESRKLETASSMGFIPVDASADDPVDQIFGRTNGGGADCVVEAVGLPKTFLQAVQCAARAGQVVFLGNIIGEFRIGEKDFSSILRRELVIRGTWNSKVLPRGKDDWTTVLSYMDRGLEVAPLISHTPPFSEGPEIFRKITEKKEYVSKVIFIPKR